MWREAEDSGGAKMWPLVYRADCDDYSPIQTACFMADQDAGCNLLRIMMQLPHNLHVQSARASWNALSLAVTSGNMKAVDLLLEGQSACVVCGWGKKRLRHRHGHVLTLVRLLFPLLLLFP